MGYLLFEPAEGVEQEIIDNGIDGKSLRVTIAEPGWYAIFGSTPESLDYVGGSKAYTISFDYEVVDADDSLNPLFYTLTYPGEMGWTETAVTHGETGRYELVMNIIEDAKDMYFTVCFYGGTEVLIDNFDIALAE
jgi:hypothetical protein